MVNRKVPAKFLSISLDISIKCGLAEIPSPLKLMVKKKLGGNYSMPCLISLWGTNIDRTSSNTWYILLNLSFSSVLCRFSNFFGFFGRVGEIEISPKKFWIRALWEELTWIVSNT